MDIIKTTSELANLVKDKNLGYIRVKDGDIEIEVAAPENISAFVPPPIHHAPAPVAAPAETSSPASAPAAPAAASGTFIKSPIVGTFYIAPAADKPPFVKIGDKIEKGKVVCIVESMKLMNEIVSECGGIVAEVFPKDGEAVEFDQPLMRIE